MQTADRASGIIARFSRFAIREACQIMPVQSGSVWIATRSDFCFGKFVADNRFSDAGPQI
jgi:hypothetical protein